MSSVTTVCFVVGFVLLASGQQPNNLCMNARNDDLVLAPGTNCNMFYSCWEGQARGPQNCAQGSLFDVTISNCTNEKEVICNDVSAPNIVCLHGVDPYNCSVFHRCVMNRQYDFTCNTGTYFKESEWVCAAWGDLSEDEQKNCFRQK